MASADVTMTSPEALSPDSADAKPSIEPVAKPASALTPPTSEEMNHDTKKEDDESELSDLDLDDDDEEEIFPDHYWDGENGGKIPVFKPTMDQFRSFKKFVEKIDKYGMKSGIVKVIPPEEWRNSLPALDEYVKRIRIKNPITQEFNGTFGTYTQQNVEKQRSYNLPEWKALTEETQYQHPAKRGERRRNQEKSTRGAGTTRERASTGSAKADDTPQSRKKSGRLRRGPHATGEAGSDDESKNKDLPAPNTPTQKPAKKSRGRPSAKGGQAKSVTSRRLNNTAESVDHIDEKAFKNFDYRMEGLEEYTPERCAELETHYWKSLGFNQPMYAADMPGSLFDDTTTSWNVAKLENLLDVLGTKVPGVNTAYLYMGMWKATFAWHLEDVDLYSINYIHFGAPKQWYSISQEDARKFERAMKSLWPVDAKNCDQFLRHKTYLISPDVLQKQYGVKVNKLVHYEGEFVITYPYGYHSGYNIGYNCAESVNFATESWLEFGRIARKCNCEADNVWVDVSEIERKLRGEPTPEYYEETDDDDDDLDDDDGNLLTPPASVKGQKSKPRKRKRDVKHEAPKKKKKIRIKIRAPTREPCCICPNDNPWEPLLPTDTGKKAHRSCALYTPETFVVLHDGKEKVCGVGNIDKARLDLKCNFCRSKRGTCFQCSSKKCTRAFHATCAVAAGVLVDGGLVPTFGEDGTEYYEEGYDFRCRYHRPKMPKNVTVESLENSKRVTNYAKDLKPNDTVQVQLIGGEVFGGLVIENRAAEMSVVVDVLPDGDRVEIEWKWLCVLDPDDSLRPKPSCNALPMPEDMHKSKFSMSNRQDGVPTQDEPFHSDPSFKWHDFHNMHMPPPGYQTVQHKAIGKLTVDMDQADQVYYYLPQLSTETKPFFTDTAGSGIVAPKANFMDRVSAAARPQYQQYGLAPSKQPLAPASRAAAPGSFYPAQSPAVGTYDARPYKYKPKEQPRPNGHCTVDYQSLANQRSFLDGGSQRPSSFGFPQQQQQSTPVYSTSHSDPARHAATPVRAFPPNQYYSSRTLPAAFPGEYSAYRRQSQGSQTLQRPIFEGVDYTSTYRPGSSQMMQTRPNGQEASFMHGSVSYPLAQAPHSRPSSSAHSHHSPTAAPPTPATTTSITSNADSSHADFGYIQSLQKYPHLMNSFCRRPKAYESPYAIGGGFSPKHQPLELQKQDEKDSDGASGERHQSDDRPRGPSVSGPQGNPQWMPPSQRPDVMAQRTPPPSSCAPLPREHMQRVQGMQSTPQDFERQINGGMASTASREGAHARMLRDQGFLGGYPSTIGGHQQPRNSFGQAYDAAGLWHSPQAPTPSPLSNPHTPGYAPNMTPTQPTSAWSALANAGGEAGGLKHAANAFGAGYGPMLPQMHGGNETWRYN